MKKYTPIVDEKHGPVRILSFGRSDETQPTNWKCLVDNGLSRDPAILERMRSTISHFVGRGEILAPNTSGFNADFATNGELQEVLALGHGVSIRRGKVAEAVEIPRGYSAAFFPADCYTVVMWSDSGTVLACHAGAFSLIDHLAVLSGQERVREHKSVIDTMIAEFRRRGDSPANLHGHVVRGVSPSNFGYDPRKPGFEDQNQKLIRAFQAIGEGVIVNENTGSLDIAQAIRLQLAKTGVPEEEVTVDNTDTYNDRDNGDFTWWSHERAEGEGNDEEVRTCRNMVLIVHY
jgi:copper oxidase (laccase) domain-containing protein